MVLSHTRAQYSTRKTLCHKPVPAPGLVENVVGIRPHTEGKHVHTRLCNPNPVCYTAYHGRVM